MITDAAITIWHKSYNAVTRLWDWEPYFFEASVQIDNKSTVLDSGLKAENVVLLRIPTADDICLANGDRVLIGKSNSVKPPDDAYTVIGFADNRKGSQNVRHWKVICA